MKQSRQNKYAMQWRIRTDQTNMLYSDEAEQTKWICHAMMKQNRRNEYIVELWKTKTDQENKKKTECIMHWWNRIVQWCQGADQTNISCTDKRDQIKRIYYMMVKQTRQTYRMYYAMMKQNRSSQYIMQWYNKTEQTNALCTGETEQAERIYCAMMNRTEQTNMSCNDETEQTKWICHAVMKKNKRKEYIMQLWSRSDQAILFCNDEREQNRWICNAIMKLSRQENV